MTYSDTNAAPATPDADDRRSEDAVAARVLVALLVALIVWGLAIFIWGLPGLYLPAVALTPVVYILLLLISFGR
jgi:fatty acid desaturase